jgi:hypothetical protein
VQRSRRNGFLAYFAGVGMCSIPAKTISNPRKIILSNFNQLMEWIRTAKLDLVSSGIEGYVGTYPVIAFLGQLR